MLWELEALQLAGRHNGAFDVQASLAPSSDSLTCSSSNKILSASCSTFVLWSVTFLNGGLCIMLATYLASKSSKSK